LEEKAKRLIAPFRKAITTRLPWVIAKVAQSLDGKIGTNTGASRWISSEAARAFTHRLRHQVDAILVGVNTVLRDDPSLSARGPQRPGRARRPMVVIVDSRLRTPLLSRCLSDPLPRSAIIATTRRAAAKRRPFLRRGIEVVSFPASADGRVPLRRLCQALVTRYGITSVLLEGGGEVLASALAQRLVDRVVWVIAPTLIGGRHSPSAVGGAGIERLTQAVRLRDVTVHRLGQDLIVDASPVYPSRR
jgi:diaminohydroxyphosphoribosylaminopyrimidine deaminase/5-amino-6-(5-phosphoribosylamino)uracil reductase